MNLKNSMNKLTMCGALLIAGLAAACGGGMNVAPPPPVGGFTVGSLKGTYAFSMSGEDSGGFPIFRIGSFQADGAGNITAAIEDVNDDGFPSTFMFTPAPTSTYTVNANGKGTLTLVHPDPILAGVNDSFQFTITLTSTSGGLLIETDGSSTMSGNFRLQNITTNLAQSYAFDTSGLNVTLGVSESIIGSFTTNGTSITGGTLDDNDGAAPSGAQPISPGTIAFDASTGAQFGRGLLQLNGLLFEFYVIDASHLQFVEIDANKATIGSAIAQSNVPTNLSLFPGSFVLGVGGGAFNSGNFGPLTRVARYTADANGTLTNIALDQNFSGGPSVFPGTGSAISAFSYTVDPSGSGRGTLTFTDQKSAFQFSYVFYLASATQGFIQDNSVNTVADGGLTMQPAGTLSSTTIAGSYAFNWSGSNGNGAGGNEEDFAGVFTIPSGGGAFTGGDVDFAELGAGKIFLDVAFNGHLTINGDGTGGGTQGNTFQIVTEQTVPGTFNFRAYDLGGNTFLIVGTDNGRVVIGTVVPQVTPQ